MSSNRIIKADQVEGLVFQRNFLKNAIAEKNVASWNGYDDGSVSRPVNGTGGTATGLTFALNTAAPLDGVASFELSKDAADRQGKGYSIDFTISPAFKFKPAQIKFTYRVTGAFDGGSSSSDSDLIVYMYRVSSTAQLIEPVPIKLDGSVPGQIYQCQSNFQLQDGVDYRLILHVATTSASAWSVVFDNILVSDVQGAIGSVVTNDIPYTPTLTNIGDATVKAAWHRVGGRCVIKGVVTIGATLPNGTGMSISFPSGIVFDTDAGRGSDNTANNDVCGWLRADPAAAQSHLGVAIVQNLSLGFYPSGDDGSGQWTDTVPFTWATGDTFAFELNFPVVGWAGTSIIGQDADTRIVSAVYTQSSGQSIPNATDTVVLYDEKIEDTHSAYNTSTGEFTAPVAGDYVFSPKVLWVTNSTGNRTLKLFKGATEIQSDYIGPDASFERPNKITWTIPLKAGEVVSVKAAQTSGGSLALFSASVYNGLSIFRLSGPAQIAANEKIVAKYRKSDAVGLTAATQVNYGDKVFDSHSLVTTGASWKFTSPRSDFYRISVALLTDNAANNLFLYVNGSSEEYVALGIDRASGPTYYYQGNTLVYLKSGEYFDIRAESTLGTTNANGTLNYICIESV